MKKKTSIHKVLMRLKGEEEWPANNWGVVINYSRQACQLLELIFQFCIILKSFFNLLILPCLRPPWTLPKNLTKDTWTWGNCGECGSSGMNHWPSEMSSCRASWKHDAKSFIIQTLGVRSYFSQLEVFLRQRLVLEAITSGVKSGRYGVGGALGYPLERNDSKLLGFKTGIWQWPDVHQTQHQARR